MTSLAFRSRAIQWNAAFLSFLPLCMIGNDFRFVSNGPSFRSEKKPMLIRAHEISVPVPFYATTRYHSGHQTLYYSVSSNPFQANHVHFFLEAPWISQVLRPL
jgi:hypothetical protein